MRSAWNVVCAVVALLGMLLAGMIWLRWIVRGSGTVWIGIPYVLFLVGALVGFGCFERKHPRTLFLLSEIAFFSLCGTVVRLFAGRTTTAGLVECLTMAAVFLLTALLGLRLFASAERERAEAEEKISQYLKK